MEGQIKLLTFLIFFTNLPSYGALTNEKFELVLNIAQTASCIAYKKANKKSRKRAYLKLYFAFKDQRQKMFNNEGPFGREMCKKRARTRAYSMYDNSAWYLCDRSSSDSLISQTSTVIHETAHIVDIDKVRGRTSECRARDHELSVLALSMNHYQYYEYEIRIVGKKCQKPTYTGNPDGLDDNSVLEFYEDNKDCKISL